MISVAIEMYISKKVLLARAAQWAQKSLGEFIDVLRSQGLAWMEYTLEDKLLDDMAIEKFATRPPHDG